MNQEIYAIKDTATQVYGQPMFLITEPQAVRMFTNEVNRESNDNPLFTNPDDFEMYRIGFYNTDAGKITPIDPVMIARAKDLHRGNKQ